MSINDILAKIWLPQTPLQQLIVAVVVVTCSYFYYKFFVAPVRRLRKIGLPFPAPTALTGNIFDYGPTKQHIAQLEWQKKYGTRYATQFFKAPAVWIAEPELLKTIMVKDFSNFANRFSFNAALPYFNKTLLELKNQDWKRVRTILIPTFTASKLKLIVPLIKDTADILIDKLIKADEKGENIDLWKASGMFSMKVILGTAFGLEFENEEQEVKLTNAAGLFFRQDFGIRQTIFQLIFFASAKLFLFLEPRCGGGNFCSSVRHIVEITKAVIKERRNNLAHDRPCRKDVLQYMIEADGSNQLSDDEMISQAFVFLVAGYETTQNALTFACYSLATNPDIQRKLIDEIDSKFPISDSLDYNIVSEMPYLDMVIAETLRLYPPAITTNREVSQSMIIDGIHIPKDVILAIPIYSIHRDPKYWHDPEQFIPERFTPEAKASRNPYAYLPFGIGPRNCVGMRLALLELKVALVKTLQNIEFFANKETEVPLKLKSLSTLSPVNPLYLGIRKRF
ncbi:uncharacterized protein TRIADDRAFT_25944 [Trichoplax adhaerens]|uniref:Cytochrome P450 n=1 Tax=Trichoplax adhaerens TaxID=10228 RepID=B3RXH1_TRIAD|nr:hypothetical protein TRIADDRAFT_25944 [Trichoplax adhaerens]EDV24425.1 hypothetical protein TRIADDRAFT_25944 [Trichoplax adhaerens]|eukprot:XP_002112315.1 hypothetical protein TRIADDRAFT_25944 [Trichoplax adhaerens]